MAQDNRQTGRITKEDLSLELQFEDKLAKEREDTVETGIVEGKLCPGCESPVDEDIGIECFCEVEGYSSEHVTFRWCNFECYIHTHEIAYPTAPPHPDE